MCRYETKKEGKKTMYSIDDKSNKQYFIVVKDGKEFLKVSKKANTLEAVKQAFCKEKAEDVKDVRDIQLAMQLVKAWAIKNNVNYVSMCFLHEYDKPSVAAVYRISDDEKYRDVEENELCK